MLYGKADTEISDISFLNTLSISESDLPSDQESSIRVTNLRNTDSISITSKFDRLKLLVDAR